MGLLLQKAVRAELVEALLFLEVAVDRNAALRQAQGERRSYFFRVKSTLTTFDPSSGPSALGASFSACSCSSGSSSAALAWNVSANSTAGSWNWVTAANGTWRIAGTPPKDRPTVKSSSSTL